MIRRAREAGIPFAWFTAGEESSQNPGLRSYLEEEAGIPYVMCIPKNTGITTSTGVTATIEKIAGKLNRTAWQRRSCGTGPKGFRVYDWALISAAATGHQYMARRFTETGELACYNHRQAGRRHRSRHHRRRTSSRLGVRAVPVRTASACADAEHSASRAAVVAQAKSPPSLRWGRALAYMR